MESAKEVWEKALGELQIQVSKANYNTWLANSQGMNCDDNIFVVSVPNAFVAEWLSQRLYPLVRKTLANITGKDFDIRFAVQGVTPDRPLAYASQPDGGTSSRAKQNQFNPKYTFDNFVVGHCNRLAYAAAVEVAENPACTYNPLFLHSDTGQGKTHLLHAIAHTTAGAGLRVAYTSAEQFTNEFVTAVRKKQVEDFRSKFRDVDIFLLDDIQFLVNKKQTLQYFVHIFNELYSNNHQIVISCDCSPKEIASLSNKLRSLLEWGLIIEMQAPDMETRLAILRAKAEAMMSPELDGLLPIIAEKTEGDIRQLEGALVYLIAQAKLSGTNITQQTINNLLTDTTNNKDIKLLLQVVTEYFNVSLENILSKKRDRKTTLARQIAMYLIREDHNYSFTEIGKELGGRNHATILHGCEKITSELNIQSHLNNQISEIREKISSHKGYRKTPEDV